MEENSPMKKELSRYFEIVEKFKIEKPKKFSFPLHIFDKWENAFALIWTDGKEVKNTLLKT